MTAQGVLLDTGPWVAILRKRDSQYHYCSERLQNIQTPLLVCWPVITEAAWLVQNDPQAIAGLFRGFSAGFVRLVDLDHAAIPWMQSFLWRYQNIGAQVADAAIMYLAERDGLDTVFTLDRRDFSIYRLPSGRALNLLP